MTLTSQIALSIILIAQSAVFAAIAQAEISALSVGYNYICIARDQREECSGENNAGQLYVPESYSPKQASVDGNYSCAEDTRDLVCRGYMGLELVWGPAAFGS